jgi:hypothetical protein
MKEAEPPEIYDVVELPEEEKGGKCTLWGDDTEEYIPCGNEIEYVFVHAATNRDDDGNDQRRNCLACERCVNIVAPEPNLVADGGLIDAQYDYINEFVIVGDFGFNRISGPCEVEKSGTKWTVVFQQKPNELTDGSKDRVPGSHDEGYAAVLIADSKVVGGGIVETVTEPEGEDETHVIVNQYAIDDQDV